MCDKPHLIGLPCDCELEKSQPSPKTAQRENITKSLTAPFKKSPIPPIQSYLDNERREDAAMEAEFERHRQMLENPPQPQPQPQRYPRRIVTQTTRTEEEGGPANPE